MRAKGLPWIIWAGRQCRRDYSPSMTMCFTSWQLAASIARRAPSRSAANLDSDVLLFLRRRLVAFARRTRVADQSASLGYGAGGELHQNDKHIHLNPVLDE